MMLPEVGFTFTETIFTSHCSNHVLSVANQRCPPCSGAGRPSKERFQLGDRHAEQGGQCPRCGALFEIEEGTLPGDLTFLLGISGTIVLAGPERPIHRCIGLSKEEESWLLQDGEWMYSQSDAEGETDAEGD
jgi:hypothetical protein